MTNQNEMAGQEIHPVNACVAVEYLCDGAVVWFESPDRSVNVIDADMLAGFEEAFEQLWHSPRRLRWVALCSRRPDCFFAGADVHRIAELHDEQEVIRLLKRGQSLTNRIASLKVPTVAVISGICLGGGLELALACRHRIASRHPSTRLGLPEVKLGLIPGWGGTQRLPRLVGARKALELIMTGKTVSAEQAAAIGLVDRVVAADNITSQRLPATIDSVIRHARAHRPLVDRLLGATSPGRSLMRWMAQRQSGYRRKLYPALDAAIEAVIAAERTGGNAWDVERSQFVKLIFTPEAQNLIRLFLDRERARNPATWLEQPIESLAGSIQRVAVIGAGTMGAGIAASAALSGLDVWVKEVNAETLAQGRERIMNLLRKQKERGRITEEDWSAAKRRLHFTLEWPELANCDLAVEAVVEVPSVKQEVFRKLDETMREGAILASNTSSLRIADMAAATARPQSVLGIHFFNPVDRMELVEIVRTTSTDDTAQAIALAFARKLGKTPVVTSDSPGFVVNRVLFPYLGQAIRMVDEGYSIKDIDHAMKRFGMPMGPLELIDQVGVDIAAHVARSMAALQPDAERSASLLQRLLDAGWLGKKAGRGFYVYSGDKRREVNKELQSQQRPSGVSDEQFLPDHMDLIQRRLVYPMLNESVRCLDEQVVSEAWIVDLAMVLGTGFAPMKGGPLRLLDTLGRSIVRHNLRILQTAYGDAYAPAKGLEMAEGEGVSSELATREHDYEHRHTPQA